MPKDTLTQRVAKISEALEILPSQSHLHKAAVISAETIDELLVSLEGLATLAGGGGMTESEQDIFAEDKVACAHGNYAVHQEILFQAARKVLYHKELQASQEQKRCKKPLWSL